MIPTNRKNRTYNCVECLTPSMTLYRQYTASVSSIKLTTCSNCGQNVDPYIEREWLLVILDCILLRLTAYRHVLFNRLQADIPVPVVDVGGKAASTTVGSICTTMTTTTAQYAAASVILDVYLKWETLRSTTFPTMEVVNFSSILVVLLLAALSCVGFALLWAGTFLLAMATMGRKAAQEYDLAHGLYLAILMPTALNTAIVLVLVWENTPTLRLLGSLFLTVFQYTAVTVVVQRAYRPNNGIKVALPFLGGVVLRSFLPLLVSTVLPYITYPCTGLKVAVWWRTDQQLCVT